MHLGMRTVRLGLTLALWGVSASWLVQTANPPAVAVVSGVIAGILGAIFGILLLIGFFVPIAALGAALLFVAMAVAQGVNAMGGAYAGLAIISAGTLLVQEEHIPRRERRLLTHIFGGKH